MTSSICRLFRVTCGAAFLLALALPAIRCSDPAIPPPLLSGTLDTTVAINDTVTIRVGWVGESVEKYRWAVTRADTVLHFLGYQPSASLVWTIEDTGMQSVTIDARGENGEWSNEHVVSVHVHAYRPLVRALRDTQTIVNDTVRMLASSFDTNGIAVRWQWSVDGAVVRDTSSTCVLVWPPADTGVHRVTVRVMDDDSLWSSASTSFVTVCSSAPSSSPDSALVTGIHDTIAIPARARDPNGTPVLWIWTVDSTFSDTLHSDTIRLSFGRSDTGEHVVGVVVLDDDSVRSVPRTVRIQVVARPPVVSAMPDTSVAVHDTLQVHCQSGDSDGTVVGWIWQADSAATDTTTDSICAFWWALRDTGGHMVIVRALDDDSLVSAPDTVRVRVESRGPTVSCTVSPSVVTINDTVLVTASGTDGNGTVVAYAWVVDSQTTADTTTSATRAFVWRAGAPGTHVVRVQAIDDDSVGSAMDSCAVSVVLDPPRLAAVRDTLLRRTDSVRVTLSATDSAGSVVSYLWDRGGDGWDATGPSPERVFTFDGRSMDTVIAGALDDDSVMARDTFVIEWNTPPDSARLVSPRDSVRVWGSPSVFSESVVSLMLEGYDRDGPRDNLRYVFMISPDSTAPFDTIDLGSWPMYALFEPAPGPRRWRLLVTDRMGESATDSGTLVILWEKRVCFLGHSIAAGTGGDGIRGGMRTTVLDSLATRIGPYQRLRSIGTIVPGYTQPPERDTCLARPGAIAREMHDSLFYNSWINADYWVMMLGVNGNYNYTEQTYVRRIIDTVYNRNPSCQMYFLNGLPIPDTLTRDQPTNDARDSFNAFLRLITDVRAGAGYKLSIVDAYSLLSTNGVFNDTLFADYLHPNQSGYERLAREIWRQMQLAGP